MKNSNCYEFNELSVTELDFHSTRDQQRRAQSEKELDDFFENGAVGMHWVGPDGIILRANRYELELLGYTHEEYVGHHIAEFHADQNVINDILKRLVDGETLNNFPARLRCKNGSIKHVVINSNVYWKNGEFKHTRCFTHDLTATRIAEQGFLASEARMSAILNSAIDAIVTIDTHGRIESLNPAAERMFGYTAKEIQGTNVNRLMPSPFSENHDGYLANYLKTGQKKIIGIGREVVGLRKDGTTFPVELAVSEVRLGDLHLFTGIVRDISERKQSERALEAANAKLAGVVDAATQVSIIATDVDGTITLFNTGAVQMLGYEAAEMIGVSTPEIFHLESEVVRRGEELSLELGRNVSGFEVFVAYAREGQFERREWTYVRKDGHKVTVNLVITAIRNSDGKINGFLGVAEDVTERKRQDAALQAAKEAAESANRAKSEFLANMSHEIRTPMTAILGYSELVLDNVSDQENIDALKTVQQSGEHLLGIINDILDLSKIDSGKLSVERIKCSPTQLVSEVAALMRVRCNEKGLPLEVQFDGRMPATIQSDPTRLKQILINLVSNAIKFAEDNKVGLTASLLDAEGDEPKIQFTIIDSGIGLREEQMTRLFKPFEQADNSTTRVYGGTGLGLTISKRLAIQLGGDITAKSTFGEGSTFIVTLETGSLDGVQMLDNPTETLFSKSSKKKLAVNTKKLDCHVLLAEDDTVNQRLITFLLKKAGAVVTLAANGQIAYDLALAARDAGNPFDVILMDMQMPVMDGYHATGKLREAAYSGPIIALTAHAMSADRDKCLNAGCDDYTTKPIDQTKLIKLVAEQAEHQQSQLSR
ncbi:Autoinducer 2 sensor kinase/phosphatase LuxQ [Symmachiella macrocystis]|uniref:Sensor protein FixL n=1 Tax=Symmachiella macrocystis TaxID=2527985 RepID=A0A5C6BMI8_9PLAN|nr:PAS domain S-box protein [Symmachiella macrocystis]TWU13343.1 Autoinducer 2 sensor kinase/phosphatase LuxQ [Symmachiella macrocystis]